MVDFSKRLKNYQPKEEDTKMTNQNQNRRDDRNEDREPEGEREKLIPAGKYKVKCLDAKMGWTAGGPNSEKKPQVGIGLEITEGPHAGRMISYYGYFTEKTEEFSVKAMRALGWRGNNWADLSSMIDGTALAVVEIETDDGKERSRVRWINQIGVAMSDAMSAADIAVFQKKMSGLAARIGGGGDKGAQAGAQKPPSKGYDPKAGSNEPPPFDPDDSPPPRGGRYGR